jgi:hypothetical protein
MINTLLQLFGEIAWNPGWHIPRATEALERPPSCPKAQRYRSAAFLLFMATALLLLSAAIVFVVAGPIFASELLGWGGVAALHACVLCGLRYERLNRR